MCLLYELRNFIKGVSNLSFKNESNLWITQDSCTVTFEEFQPFV